MPRTVVFDSPEVQAQYEQLVPDDLAPFAPRKRAALRREAETKARTQAVPATTAAHPSADDYKTKLAKYVPVELVTLTATGFAVFNGTGAGIWAGLAVGALATPVYLFFTSLTLDPKTPRPRWYFYALSAAAFVAWLIGTTPEVASQMNLDSDQAKYILTVAAFAIPGLDTALGYVKIHLPQPQTQ
jgi:hypothetical protein